MSKERSKKHKKYAPTMKLWIIFTPLLALAFGFAVLYSDYHIRKAYKNLNDAMFDYSECNQAISNFREASEYLTNQVRFFVLNQNSSFMSSYVYETEVIDRRGSAVKIVEVTHLSDAVDENISRALTESQNLTSLEYYAMKLVCEAADIAEEDIPFAIRNTNLSKEDLFLSSEMKLQKAQAIVYDYEYLTAKNRIMRYSAGAHNSLVEFYMQIQRECDLEIEKLFRMQIVFVILVLVTFIIFNIFLVCYVLVPIRRNVVNIEGGKRMTLSGAREVLTIAKAYNSLCDKNEVTASVLKHKAEHDPLTGLINREAFENIKLAYTGLEEEIAYLMLDIDLFKQINDKHGHLIGDDVLRKVSELLVDHFRNTDYVARIGGDEFAIIMTKLGGDPEEIIKRKIKNLNTALLSINDGLPAVSLSVGAAISDSGFTEELVKYADQALYRVKENGRCDCIIHEQRF